MGGTDIKIFQVYFFKNIFNPIQNGFLGFFHRSEEGGGRQNGQLLRKEDPKNI